MSKAQHHLFPINNPSLDTHRYSPPLLLGRVQLTADETLFARHVPAFFLRVFSRSPRCTFRIRPKRFMSTPKVRSYRMSYAALGVVQL